jgi:hypothetical protein
MYVTTNVCTIFQIINAGYTLDMTYLKRVTITDQQLYEELSDMAHAWTKRDRIQRDVAHVIAVVLKDWLETNEHQADHLFQLLPRE